MSEPRTWQAQGLELRSSEYTERQQPASDSASQAEAGSPQNNLDSTYIEQPSAGFYWEVLSQFKDDSCCQN